jgi:hypothetical protein
MNAQLHPLLTSISDEVTCSTSRPVRLTTLPITGRMEPRTDVDFEEQKNRPPLAGIKPQSLGRPTTFLYNFLVRRPLQIHRVISTVAIYKTMIPTHNPTLDLLLQTLGGTVTLHHRAAYASLHFLR